MRTRKRSRARFRSSSKKPVRVFSKKDYISGDGMLTTIWGPNMWHYLHTMSFNYPINPDESNKKYYKEFVLNLQHTLPCKYCRINLKNNLEAHPLLDCYMKNRDTFSKYIYRLHEIVNKLLNKKSGLSYCDVRERYEHFRARCTDEKPSLFKFKRQLTRKKRRKEKGCTEPLYGKKSKCVMNIVPQDDRVVTLKIDDKCIKQRT